MNAKIALGLGTVLLLAACGGNNQMPKSCEEMIDWHMKKMAEIIKSETQVIGAPVFIFNRTVEIDIIGVLQEWGDEDTSLEDFKEGKSSEVIDRAKKYYAAKLEAIEKEKGKKNADLFREEAEKTCKKMTDESIEFFALKKSN